MSNVSHQNPNFPLNESPHKLSTKHDVLIKTKPTKRSPRSNKNKINNIINNTNKPLKVVHISNPIKYEATPTEFRALVQELTGRDAVLDWLDDHCGNYQPTVAGGGAGGDANGSSDGGVTDDQVIQGVHQVNNVGDDNNYDDVTSFAACFGPSDHFSYDCFGPFHIDEDFRALLEDH